MLIQFEGASMREILRDIEGFCDFIAHVTGATKEQMTPAAQTLQTVTNGSAAEEPAVPEKKPARAKKAKEAPKAPTKRKAASKAAALGLGDPEEDVDEDEVDEDAETESDVIVPDKDVPDEDEVDEDEADEPEDMRAAVALDKVKNEQLDRLRDLFNAGKGKFVRDLLKAHGRGAKVFPEVDAKFFPQIKLAIDKELQK